MKVMHFNRLTILSKKAKKAAQFDFSRSYNLILSKQKNSVGKSSLVKNIFWCFGCEPQLDDNWKSLDCRVILDFDVKGKSYQIARHGNRFILKDQEGKHKVFTGTGGDFSAEIMALFEFDALLAVRDKDEVVTPPPAYYFLPFYIDQKQSWANAWSSFNNLAQFASWKKTIIPYHTGMIGKDYFDKTKQICSKKIEMAETTKEIDRFDTAISVISEFSANNSIIIDEVELDEIEEELSINIMDLHFQQEILFEELANLRAEKAHIESQIVIARQSFEDAVADFEFAERLDEDIECPTCGVVHDNSIVNRFSLFQDGNQAKEIIERFQNYLVRLEHDILTKDSAFKSVREKINELDKKYSSDQHSTRSLSSVLDAISSKSVRKKVEANRSLKIESLHKQNQDEKLLVKDRTALSKDSRRLVNEAFQECFPRYLWKLKAFGVNANSIKSPENYTKVAESGGAAESTRAMLAYYISVYNLIYKYGNHVLSPLVIDTPNQHEQAAKHYESIVSLLIDELPEHSQLFVCGMDSSKLELLKSKAKTIYLDEEHSLLKSNEFEKVDFEYSGLFDLKESSV
ncbi:hypothetical protein [Rheinheimera soli]|uniref:hypothetical protein n=1 Tax=Rheinheimera soli TaxID=443616 RepID=UPI001E4BC741|nr:hypothetical protein [Rheinheimera soli]